MIAVSAPLCNEAFFYGITSEMSYVLFQSLRLERWPVSFVHVIILVNLIQPSCVSPIDHTP